LVAQADFWSIILRRQFESMAGWHNGFAWAPVTMCATMDANKGVSFAGSFFAFPCAATDSMAFLTVSSSPRNFIETIGFMFSSSS